MSRFLSVIFLLFILIAPLRETTAAGTLPASDNRFGFALYARLQAAAPNATVVISPTGLALDLQAAYLGARGSTATGMATALRLGHRDGPTTALDAHALLSALHSGNGSVRLSLADALFLRQGVAFQPAFLNAAHNEFDARASTLDFASPGALAAINDWVRRSTRGAIPSILDRVDPQAVLYMLNAVYFHASWAHPFDPRNTHNGTFIAADGTTQTVHAMHLMGNFLLYTNSQVEAIGLPYAGNRYEMDILVPPQGVSLAQFAGTLTATSWARWTSGLQPSDRELVLPRFTVAPALNLDKTLQQMGMAQAFSRAADFSGLCARMRCRITQVLHRTYLSVGELGTTAAAATSVGIGITAVPLQVIVDRPFVVAIRDTRTGAILFLGGITSIPR